MLNSPTAAYLLMSMTFIIIIIIIIFICQKETGIQTFSVTSTNNKELQSSR